MASPITGVWELVSDTAKSLWIMTETYHAGVIERPQGRRGYAATYTVEGNRFDSTILVDTATNVPTSVSLEFQREGDTLTTTRLTPGTISLVGHVDTWRKVSDLTMTSPFAGVWQLISETDKSLAITTDTHWVNIRGTLQRGFAGTRTIAGNRVSNAVLFCTVVNAPTKLETEVQREGEILTVTLLGGGVTVPVGNVTQWHKIG